MQFQLPQNTIFYELEKAIKLYRKMAQEQINAAGYQVSINQVILLLQLTNYPESTQVELSQAIFKDFASVARMVDLLVRNGFLTRTENQNDRRKKDLKPTDLGKKMVADLKPIINNYRQMALQDFSQEDIQQLTGYLLRLSENCQAYTTTKSVD